MRHETKTPPSSPRCVLHLVPLLLPATHERKRNTSTRNASLTWPQLIESLTSSDDANTSATGQELEALESIYPGAILLSPTPSPSRNSSGAGSPSSSTPGASHRLRYEITLPAWEDGGLSPDDADAAPRIRVLVTLPAEYPDRAPLLQIMGRYVGKYAIEPGLCEYGRGCGAGLAWFVWGV